MSHLVINHKDRIEQVVDLCQNLEAKGIGLEQREKLIFENERARDSFLKSLN